MSEFNGVIVGTVVDPKDPDNMGRIQVQFPWLGGQSISRWAPVSAPFAGSNRGLFYMPEKDDEVLVAFDHGDVQLPFVIGFLWNGRDRPPAEDVRERIIRSKNGHAIRMLDSTPTNGDKGALIIEDAHGNLVLMANGLILIQATAVLDLNAPTVRINGRVVSPNSNPI